jgi:hypothetical protein
MGFALVPAGQAGWTHVWQDEAGGDESNQGLLVLGGNLTGILLFPTGTGFFYVAPRIGINNLRVVGDAPEQADSVNLLTFGGAIGIDMVASRGASGCRSSSRCSGHRTWTRMTAALRCGSLRRRWGSRSSLRARARARARGRWGN